jgi:hypothetical protein
VGNTIIAGNANNSVVPDVFGAFTSSGHNLIGNAGSPVVTLPPRRTLEPQSTQPGLVVLSFKELTARHQ